MKRQRRAPFLDTEPTARELEVMSLLATGMQQREVAFQLGITYQTVKNHAEMAYRRAGASSLQDWLFKRGWTKIPDYAPPPMTRRVGTPLIRSYPYRNAVRDDTPSGYWPLG